MADMHIKVGGAWKAIDAASVKVSGAWKDVQNIYCKVGGAWKTVWEAVTYTLLGSSGAPQSRTSSQLDPDDASLVWQITGVSSGAAVKGKIQYDDYATGDPVSLNTQHEFITPTTGWGVLYFRLTYDTGSDTVLSSSHAIDGTTWHALTEDTNNIFWTTEETGLVPTTTTRIKVEMSTDSGGSPIVATGYYEAVCDVSA